MDRKDMISVILPCYNAEKTINETLISLNSQDFYSFEVVIINDGSSDHTLQLIKSFSFREGIVLKLISRPNRGFLYSLDEGIKQSSGEYIARIDSDDVWYPNHLTLLYNEFVNNNNLVLVGSNADVVDENNNKLSVTNLPLKHEDIIKCFLKDNCIIHSSVMFKKVDYFKLPGYLCGETQADMHISDFNLWVDLSTIGLLKNIQEPTIKYRYLSTSMSRTINLKVNYQARLRVCKKVYSLYGAHHLYFYWNYFKTLLNILRYSL